MRVALLDDYQDAALGLADWASLPAGSEVISFRDHLSDEAAIAERLKDFEVVVGMRERTPFPRTLLERLPNLKLLITTGGRNASFDVAAANERGVTVRYDWNVGTSQPWMNALAPFIGPLFTWNHDLVMRWGEDGLREHLGIAPVERDEDPERTLRRRLVIAGGVAVALFMTVRNWRRGRSRD